MNGDWGSGWMGMGFGGGLLMLLFWGLAIVGFVALVRWIISWNEPGRGEREPDALDILKRRYASGEIDQKTYQEMKRELGSGT